MDGADNAPGKPIQLSSRQIELVHELSLVSAKFNFGQMFEGAIHALHNSSNPEALPQAAHSLRELMEKLEGVRGIPVTDKAIVDGDGSLGQKTRELHAQWNAAKANSKCLSGAPAADQIDTALRKLLGKVAGFFDWFEKNPKFLANKARGVVKGLDPLAAMLPQAVQEAQAQEWRALKEYFISTSHHGNNTTFAAMEATTATLERFLHTRMASVKAQNQSAIEKLIKDVEG
jgi:hypothetical protein